MIALIAIALLLLTSPSASIRPNKPAESAPAFRAAAHADCFAMCEHASHGSYGWLGPLRSGANGAGQAANDAAVHNNSNPGHTAWSSCNESNDQSR
jgi:hypothetical protein